MAKESNTDSVNHTEDRLAKMRAESARLAKEETKAKADRDEKQAQHDYKADVAEANMVEKQAGLLHPGETRDMLLERVRQMREEKLPVPVGPPPLTEFMRQQLEIEQNAGREAVKRAEEQLAYSREAREKAAAEEKARQGTMETVHQPNPGMGEQFPANKATLGKTK